MKLLATFAALLASTLGANVHTVSQFPNSTWLENIAPTCNGSLLVSVIGRPEVHLIHPNTFPATASLVTTFPNANAVFGITELSRNIFAVAVGSVHPTNAPFPGSFSIWTISLSSHARPTITKLVSLPNISMINGMTTLNPHTLLFADSWTGNIVRIDIKSAQYDIAISDPTLEPNFSSPALPLGVNGIRIHGDHLYFSNTVQNRLGRARINPVTGHAISAVETIVQGEQISMPDDFLVTGNGEVLLARPLGDTVLKIERDGAVMESVVVEGATSVVFGGKKGNGEERVFVSTSGWKGGAPAGGGRVVEVEF